MTAYIRPIRLRWLAPPMRPPRTLLTDAFKDQGGRRVGLSTQSPPQGTASQASRRPVRRRDSNPRNNQLYPLSYAAISKTFNPLGAVRSRAPGDLCDATGSTALTRSIAH